MATIYILIGLTLNAAGNIFLKIASPKGIHITNMFMWLGLMCFGLNAVFYFLALKHLPISIAYPSLVVGSFFIIGFAGFIYFKEIITIGQIAGYVLIALGIILVVSQRHV